MLSRRDVTRHIQLKSVMIDGKADHTTVSLRLLEKPGGCVIWTVVTPDLDVAAYLWFGNPPGQPLPDITGYPLAKHAKGNSEGVKTVRSNHRIVRRSRFQPLRDLDSLLDRLFALKPPADDRQSSPGALSAEATETARP